MRHALLCIGISAQHAKKGVQLLAHTFLILHSADGTLKFQYRTCKHLSDIVAYVTVRSSYAMWRGGENIALTWSLTLAFQPADAYFDDVKNSDRFSPRQDRSTGQGIVCSKSCWEKKGKLFVLVIRKPAVITRGLRPART